MSNAPQRTWGRTPIDEFGNRSWVEVTPDSSTGLTDIIWITTLAQALLLNLGESPFYADYGIPAQQSVATQIYPDFYLARAQQRFASHFANLVIQRAAVPQPPPNPPVPTYSVFILTNQGLKLQFGVPIPT